MKRSLFVQFFNNPRIKRLFQLNFFNAVGFVSQNGILRLVLFPFLSRVLGEQRFGDFLTGFSFSNTLSVVPSIGLTMSLVRSHASYSGPEREVYLRTMVLLSLAASPLLILIYWFSAPILDGFFSGVDLMEFRTPLALYLGVFFLYTMLGGVLGSEKRYITKSLYDTASGILCLAVIPMYYWVNEDFSVYVLILAYGICIVGQSWELRNYFWKRQVPDKGILKMILRVSILYSGISIVDIMLQYGNRWIVGYYLDSSAVSAYFAGLSVVLIFCMAFGMIAQLETMIISQRENVSDLRWADIRLLLIGLAFSMTLLPLAGFFAGKWVLFLLYDKELATRGLEVYQLLWILWVAMPAMYLFRPFIVKYCKPKVPLLFSSISATASVGTGILLIPQYGIRGAAIAACVTQCTICCLFAGMFFRTILVPVYRQHKAVCQNLVQ